MGLLEKLWDETLAGPTPESGLGKLRKYNSFSGESPTTKINLSVSVDSPASTAPNYPFSPDHSTTPASASRGGGNLNKLSRRKSAAAAASPKSPTGYDWIVLSALDR